MESTPNAALLMAKTHYRRAVEIMPELTMNLAIKVADINKTLNANYTLQSAVERMESMKLKLNHEMNNLQLEKN
jgi:hypothetical protein